MADPPRLYTPKDVARMFQVSVDTIRREVERGNLRYIRVGDQIRFQSGELKRYLKHKATAPARRRTRR